MKNVVERAVYRSDGKRIAHVDFDPFRSPYILPPEMHEQDSKDQPLSKDELSPAANSSFEEAVQAYEVRLLKDALEKTRFHQRRAADRLGLSYHQFRGLYRKHSAELIQGEKQP